MRNVRSTSRATSSATIVSTVRAIVTTLTIGSAVAFAGHPLTAQAQVPAPVPVGPPAIHFTFTSQPATNVFTPRGTLSPARDYDFGPFSGTLSLGYGSPLPASMSLTNCVFSTGATAANMVNPLTQTSSVIRATNCTFEIKDSLNNVLLKGDRLAGNNAMPAASDSILIRNNGYMFFKEGSLKPSVRVVAAVDMTVAFSASTKSVAQGTPYNAPILRYEKRTIGTVLNSEGKSVDYKVDFPVFDLTGGQVVASASTTTSYTVSAGTYYYRGVPASCVSKQSYLSSTYAAPKLSPQCKPYQPTTKVLTYSITTPKLQKFVDQTEALGSLLAEISFTIPTPTVPNVPVTPVPTPPCDPQ